MRAAAIVPAFLLFTLSNALVIPSARVSHHGSLQHYQRHLGPLRSSASSEDGPSSLAKRTQVENLRYNAKKLLKNAQSPEKLDTMKTQVLSGATVRYEGW